MPCTKHHAMHMACERWKSSASEARLSRGLSIEVFICDGCAGLWRVCIGNECVCLSTLCAENACVTRGDSFRYDDIQVFRCIFGSTTLEEIMHRKT